MTTQLTCCLAPRALYCTSAEWRIEEFRDKFIKLFFKHMDELKNLELELVCTDTFFSIWYDVMPWKEWRQWGRLSQIISKLQSLLETVENSENLDTCSIDPDISEYGFSASLTSSTLKGIKDFKILLHILIHHQRDPNIGFGINKDKLPTSSTLSCNCGHQPITAQIIEKPEYWAKCIDPLRYWPNDSTKNCYQNFRQMIRIALIRDDLELVSDFQCDRNFLAEIAGIHDKNMKTKVLKVLVQRLSLTQQQARGHHGLQDEKVEGCHLFSIRVDQKHRILYRCSQVKGNVIILSGFTPHKYDRYCR